MQYVLRRASFFLAFGAAVSILFSIAVSQILLALALACLLTSGERLRFPPLLAPLAAFFVITVIAVLASADPHGGLPQIRKFFVFAILLVVYSTFENMRQVLALLISWAAIGLFSGLMGMVQFAHRRQELNTYDFLLDGRITGFASHWMTFGGEEMIVLLMLAALVLFSGRRMIRIVGWPVLAVLIASVTLGMTRSVFLLGVPLGLTYLLWRRRRVLVFVAAAAMAVGVAIGPPAVRERAISIFRPHGVMDSNSNAHRAVCRIVGWEMVKAHPWLGLGPEQIAKQFNRYVPASVPQPLPRGWYGHLHNVYLQYAAERGIFALMCILWLIGKAAADFLKCLRRPALDPDVRAVLHGAVAAILAVLAEGFFEYNLGDSEVLTMFLSVIACSYVAIRVSAERPGNSLRLATREHQAQLSRR
ncbi:MAG: O-antigen ligase family protein [Ignavibacteriota bacterium]